VNFGRAANYKTGEGAAVPFAAGNQNAKFAVAPALMGVSGLTANKPAVFGTNVIRIGRKGPMPAIKGSECFGGHRGV